jgi:hypothetical protein
MLTSRRVALVAVICDRPAASEVGGFAANSHRLFFPRDVVQKKDLRTAKCFEKDGGFFLILGSRGD